jgi:hypothetical protein
MVATKTCSACGETKPLIEFFKRKRGKDGYNSQCKLCVAKMPGQREADRERAAQWRRDNPERHQANTRAYRERNPERHVARNAVYFAVKRGELVRQPCEGAAILVPMPVTTTTASGSRSGGCARRTTPRLTSSAAGARRKAGETEAVLRRVSQTRSLQTPHIRPPNTEPVCTDPGSTHVID